MIILRCIELFNYVHYLVIRSIRETEGIPWLSPFPVKPQVMNLQGDSVGNFHKKMHLDNNPRTNMNKLYSIDQYSIASIAD